MLDNTILSSFDERGTLLKWLKAVEEAIKGDTLESINATQIDATHIKFTLTMKDGSTFESDEIELPTTTNGISSIEKTSTSGLVDTYTITYTNGNTSTFEVTNGADGQDGATGNGISSIEKTSTSGLVDTYTITYTNGNTSTFDVTNGQNGIDGQDGTNGVSVTNATINSSHHLILTLSNGNTIDAGEIIDDLQMDLLWESNNYSAGFSAQTITLNKNINEYKYLQIIFRSWYENDNEFSSNLIKLDTPLTNKYFSLMVNGGATHGREGYISDTNKLTFLDGYRNNSNTSGWATAVNTPIRVYGIK